MRESAERPRHNLHPRVEENADYFSRLGVRRDASRAEMKAAYYALAKQYHPNGTTGDTLKMQLINEAWEHLRDDDKRADYIGKLAGEDAAVHRAQQEAYAHARGAREDVRGPGPEAGFDAFARERGFPDFASYYEHAAGPERDANAPKRSESPEARTAIERQRERMAQSLELLGAQTKLTCFTILYNTFALPFKRVERGEGRKKKKEFDPAAQIIAGVIGSSIEVGILVWRILGTSSRAALYGFTKLRYAE